MQQMQLKHHQRDESDEEETCRFPKLQECAHFHYERVQLCPLQVSLQVNNGDISIHSLQHTSRGSDENPEEDWYTVQVTSNNECWLLQRSLENFVKLDSQLHQCIFDRKVSQLTELTHHLPAESITDILTKYLERFCQIIDNSLNCGPILTWFQLDNRGHRLLVPNEESDSINTPAVAAAYSIKKYVSQARDELNLEVGDMISVIDMASPGESMWWRGKRGFQVGFFPQHCVHVIGEKLACLPHAPNALGSAGSGTVSPIKPVLRKHGKLIAFFRSFILNRPSRRRLKQSGILRERVFGCDLGEHLLNSQHEIPMVLKCCAEFIESHGIVDGIYRLSGVTSNIQKLRNAFDEDRIPNLYTEDILQDIHSVASLLKMYFRELPNPLCTHQLYHSFVNAVQGTQINRNGEQIKVDENERLLRMRETVHKLPPPHYRTLEYLMRHLARVAKHGARTGMTSRNVAIVWAPNLLRCAELEIGGVAALQGVGVQAVVTEFLVCYTDLIFCDNIPTVESDTDTMTNNSSSLSPKKLRPKSLALSTPTKLLSLEEARSKHLLSNKPDESSYIEVGGGPKNLPEKYHTVLELPQGFRKRSMSKRSPLGWRSFFTKSRNTSHTNLAKNTIRKASTPGINTSFQEKSVTESDLTEIRRKLRPVKSAESLTSGQSEPPSTEIDTLGPLHCLNKPSGHNRSVSHDSYFDTLQASNNNSEGSLLDLSEIQLNFELEESEMRIFSEDESLVSSPRVHKESGTRKVLHRARPEDFNSQTNSSNPSPKKQPRVILSPESQSRKRSRLEDQLSDILYIDCNTPENMISTTAIVHTHPEKTPIKTPALIADDSIEPKNKSPRNSNEIQPIKTSPEENLVKPEPENLFKKNTNRNSLNLENYREKNLIPKSYTEMDIKRTLQIPSSSDVCSEVSSTNISPQTPNYNRLYGETTDSSDSTTTTPNQISPDFSLTESPGEISYKIFNRNSGETKDIKLSNTYENIANELSNNGIISPKKTPSSPTYENVLTTISITYSLNSPSKNKTFTDKKQNDTNIYEDVEINSELKATIPTSVANLPNREASQPTEIVYRTKVTNIDELLAAQKQKSLPTSPSVVKTMSPPAARPTSLSFSPDSNPINYVSPIRPISLSFQANNYAEDSETPIYENVEVNEEDNSQSFPASPSKPLLLNEKRKSCENSVDDDAIYQQVKYFRRSIHEINELLDKPLSVSTNNSIVNSPEQVQDVSKPNSIVSSPDEAQDVSKHNSIVEPTQSPEQIQENDVTDSLTPEDVKVVPENNVQCIENSSNIVNIEHVVNENDNSAHVSVVDVCMPEENEQQCKISDEDTIDNMSDKFDSLEMEKTVIIEEDENEESTPPSKNESPKVVHHQRHRTESVREIANKFENLDPASSSECSSIVLRYKDINGRDSLPPCLRHARHTKLLKNNPKARSLDENEFIREFVTKPLTTFSQQAIINQSSSTSRRKSLDERLNRFTIAQPKQLNQPKVLPDTAKKSPDFHSLHSFHTKKSTDSLSSSTSSLKQSNILKDIKNNTKDHDHESTVDQHPSLSSTSLNSTTDFENPQLNRERIERYKEERRNFLREKYRSESFRADNKDQVLTRLKSKIKPRGEENKDDGVEDDVNRRNKLKSNNENMESPVLNQRNIKRNEKIVDGCDVIKNNQIRKNNTIISDYTKKFCGSDNNTDKNNTTMGTIRSDNMNNEKGVRKKDYFDNNKITQRREKAEELICASNEIRRHTFDTLMARERDIEFDREKRISLDSKLSNRSPKKEKRSPSYIKDMTAMFESKSNNQS